LYRFQQLFIVKVFLIHAIKVPACINTSFTVQTSYHCQRSIAIQRIGKKW